MEAIKAQTSIKNDSKGMIAKSPDFLNNLATKMEMALDFFGYPTCSKYFSVDTAKLQNGWNVIIFGICGHPWLSSDIHIRRISVKGKNKWKITHWLPKTAPESKRTSLEEKEIARFDTDYETVRFIAFHIKKMHFDYEWKEYSGSWEG